MANKETQELIVEAINYYIEKGLITEGACPAVEVMRKIVKLDDIKTGLEKKGDEQ